MTSSHAGKARGRILLFWVVTLTVGLAVRFSDVGPVFQPDGVRLIGPDAYYHTRRAAMAVLNYPSLPSFDPYLNYPDGALCPYEPGFDLVLATVTRATLAVRPLDVAEVPSDGGAGAADARIDALEARTRSVGAMLMPWLGLLVLPLYAAAGSRLGGPLAPRLTAVLLAVLPGAAFASTLGQVDHHLFESIITGLFFLAALDLVLGKAGPWRGLGWGVLLGASLVFWRGIVLPAGLLWATLGFRTLWRLRRGYLDQTSRHGALVFAMAAAASLPVGYWFPAREPFSYFTISLLQPAALALEAVSLLALGQVSSMLIARARRRVAGPRLDGDPGDRSAGAGPDGVPRVASRPAAERVLAAVGENEAAAVRSGIGWGGGGDGWRGRGGPSVAGIVRRAFVCAQSDGRAGLSGSSRQFRPGRRGAATVVSQR